MSFNQLKVEDIEKIFIKIYENACELLEEAELLYNHEKYARAYLCAHIAFEEFGKLPMLNTVVLNINQGIKTDWKKLNRRIRDHKQKITQSYTTVSYVLKKLIEKYKGQRSNKEYKSQKSNKIPVFDNKLEEIKYVIENEIEINPMDILDYAKSPDRINDLKIIKCMSLLLNEYKNSSLYADFNEGRFLKPSESIDKETCEYALILAYIQKKFIDIPKIHIHGYKPYLMSDEIKKILRKDWEEVNKHFEEINRHFKGGFNTHPVNTKQT